MSMSNRISFICACLVLTLVAGFTHATPTERLDIKVTRGDLYKDAMMQDRDAQYLLGKSLCCGQSNKFDTIEATRWLCMAAIDGDQVEAQEMLARIHASPFLPVLTGKKPIKGLDKERYNLPLALMWAYIAAERDNDVARNLRDKLLGFVSERDKLAASRLLLDWRQVECHYDEVYSAPPEGMILPSEHYPVPTPASPSAPNAPAENHVGPSGWSAPQPWHAPHMSDDGTIDLGN
ncbi:MAG: hypothetical protein U9N14_05885 [Pseudomonadota bacterium]|nr:hypothetical protein [Pseudomonadota bacterium]